MGIWQRAKNVLKSNTPADELGDLDQSYREQTQLLAQARRSVADLTTSRRRVELQLSKLGDDASTASIRADLERHLAQLTEDEHQLSSNVRELEAQIETFRLRKDTTKARRTAAEARLKAHDAFADISGKTTEALAKAERHTAELEATADAFGELRQTIDDADDFDRRMAELESDTDGPNEISPR